MDVERFIPCLIKTTNNYVAKAREHFEANKSVFEKMDFLPENLCPDGERDHMHGLYGTTVDFRYGEYFVNGQTKTPCGISIEVSFMIDGFQHEIYFSSLDDEETVKERIAHHFHARVMNMNRYIEELEKVQEVLRGMKVYFFN